MLLLLFSGILLVFGDATPTNNNTTNISIAWKIKHDYPPPRSGATTTAINSTHMILAFGKQPDELNDVWILNTITRRWTPVRVGAGFPSPQARSFACGIVVGDGFYVFGGLSPLSAAMNDFWVLNLTQKAWFALERYPRDVWPEATSKCSMVHSPQGPCLLLGTAFPYEYNVDTEKWTQFRFVNMPFDHNIISSCCAQVPYTNNVNNQYVYVCYGGSYADDPNNVIDSLLFFNVSNRTAWIPSMSAMSLVKPPLRSGTQCYVSEKKQLFIFSGHSVNHTDLHDEWKYDINTSTWSAIQTRETRTVLLTKTVKLSPQKIVTFSGYSNEEPYTALYLEFDDATGEFTVINDERPVPTPRFGSVLFVLGSTAFMAFGALVDATHSVVYPQDTAWSLNIDTNSWSPILPFDSPGRVGASVVVVGQQALLFFGRTTLGVTDDVLRWMPFESPGTIEVVAHSLPWPPARYYHGTCFLNIDQKHVLMFGGVSSSRRSLGDTWMLDVQKNRWVLITSRTIDKEFARYQISMVLTSLGIVMYGGVNEVETRHERFIMMSAASNINSSTMQWQVLPDVPPYIRRSGFVSLSSPTSSMVYTFGGDSFVATDYLVDFNTSTPTPPVEIPRMPVTSGARLCSYAPYRDRFIVFGCADDSSTPLGVHMEVYSPLQSCAPGSVGATCELCPAGTYGSLDVTVSQCSPCPPGTRGSHAGLHGMNACTPCDANTYQPSSGQRECLPCPSNAWCPVGSVTPQPSTVIANNVVHFLPETGQGPNNVGVQPVDTTSNGVTIDTLYNLLIFGIALVAAYMSTVGLLVLVNAIRRTSSKQSSDEALVALKKLFDAMTARGTSQTIKPSVLRALFAKHSDGSFLKSANFLQVRSIFAELIQNGYQLDVTKLGLPAETTSIDVLKEVPVITCLRLDMYSAVPHDLGDVVTKLQTHLGGLVSLFAVVAVAIVVFYYTADYVENNHVETRSVLPTVLLPDIDNATGTHISLSLRYIGVPPHIPCACHEDDMFVRLPPATILEYKSHTIQCSKNIQTNSCEVVATLMGWAPLGSSTNGVVINFEALHSDFRADVITAEVSTGTGGSLATDMSLSRTLIQPSNGYVLRGMEANTSLEVLMFPVVVQNYDGTEGYGYMNAFNKITIGQQTPPPKLNTAYGVVVNVMLNLQPQTGIRITRRDRISPIVFLSNVVAIVPAVMKVCGLVLGGYYILWKRFFVTGEDDDSSMASGVYVRGTDTEPSAVMMTTSDDWDKLHNNHCVRLCSLVDQGIPYAIGRNQIAI
eukprot:PhF_6_TR23273/c0_g1_i1/m.32744